MRYVEKDILELVKPHIKAGTVTLKTGGKHASIVRADGHKLPLAGSVSDHRAILNFKSQLRKFITGQMLGKHH